MVNPLKQESARTDFLIATAAIVVALILGFLLGLFEHVDHLLNSSEHWQVDAVLLSTVLIALAALWFSWRRWQEMKLAIQRTEKAETYAHDILVNMKVGLLVYHLEDIHDEQSLRLMSANAAASEFTGTNIEKLVGLTIHEAFPLLQKTALPARYAEVIRTGRSFSADGVAYRDQTIHTAVFSVRAFPLPNQCVGIAFENTTQKSQNQALLSAIAKAQSLYISDESSQKLFDTLLNELLIVTNSRYGFVGRVLYGGDQRPYLKTLTLTNIAWDTESRALYKQFQQSGMEFTNPNSLLGEVIKTGKVVIANDPLNDPRGYGLPGGHPSLDSFLGLPLYSGETMIGMIGMANRPKGYNLELVDFLKPLTTACAQLIHAFNQDQEKKRVISELELTQSRYEEVQRISLLGHWELNLMNNATQVVTRSISDF